MIEVAEQGPADTVRDLVKNGECRGTRDEQTSEDLRQFDQELMEKRLYDYQMSVDNCKRLNKERQVIYSPVDNCKRLRVKKVSTGATTSTVLGATRRVSA